MLSTTARLFFLEKRDTRQAKRSGEQSCEWRLVPAAQLLWTGGAAMDGTHVGFMEAFERRTGWIMRA